MRTRIVDPVETGRIALRIIWAHKLRSVLTLLGMVVSVASTVLVVSLIQGFNLYVDEKVAEIGSKFFTIDRFGIDDFKDIDAFTQALKRNKYLTMEEYSYLESHATLLGTLGVRAMPVPKNVGRGQQTLKAVPVSGATANIADVERIEISAGRFFTDSEEGDAARVIFVGADVANNLFSTDEILNQEIRISGLPYRVIGVARAKGTVFGIPQDMFAIIPLQTYERDFGPLVRQRALYFNATAKSDEDFDDAVDESRQLLRQIRRLRKEEKDNFGIITPDSITEMRDKIFGPIFVVAIAIPSIALVVGAIVIMNTMLVSVTERTREIGLRKAVGARHRDILVQFLVEAIVLSTLGGVTGILIASGIAEIIDRVFFQTRISAIVVLLAITVSACVGIFAGLMPAWKAARLDPVTALSAE